MSRDQPRWDVIVTNAENRLGYTLLRSLARSGLKVGLGVPSHSGMGVYSRYGAGHFRHPSHLSDPRGFMAALGRLRRFYRIFSERLRRPELSGAPQITLFHDSAWPGLATNPPEGLNLTVQRHYSSIASRKD